MPQALYIATFIISLFILVGLGGWLMIRAMGENPHEQKFGRLEYIQISKQKKLRRAKRHLAKAEALFVGEEKALKEILTQWGSRAGDYLVLGESAKSTYRRALVNQVGDPEFTTKYLPKERFSLERNQSKNGRTYKEAES